MRRQYFYCFWFSAQIFTTVGDTPLPKREEEYLFMIADLLIAVLVFASIVGNVGNVITSLRDRDNVFFPNHELVSWTTVRFFLVIYDTTQSQLKERNGR